ncbi:MAG: DNA polymerase III subunit delta, partial [Oscillospiraceae bacterium]|nr:DNA polymerase III subunit delta [Oscillospiraceae bacterium]
MAKKSTDNAEYNALRDAVKAGTPARLYIFHGEEPYLREAMVASLRECLLPGGTNGFNYRRFSGRVPAETLREAVETLPAFAERTLVEVMDYEFSRDLEAIMPTLRDLPEYICLVFINSAVEFKPDKRQKITAELLKLASVVEFSIQEQSKLVPWVRRHFDSRGKRISPADAEYLAFITGGLMTSLIGEIDKLAAYAAGDTVTRAEIDALVTPVLEAEIYNLTDAVAKRDYRAAAEVLRKLIALREA